VSGWANFNCCAGYFPDPAAKEQVYNDIRGC
jgi:hypothetical protein